MSERSDRADRLAVRVSDEGLDAVLVTALPNVRYLTGYSGTNGLALIGGGRDQIREFVTDFRYVEQAAEEVDPAFARHRAAQDLLELVPELLERGRLGFEADHMSVATHHRLGELCGDAIELVKTSGFVERLRRVKSTAEVAAIRAATELADEALEAVLADGLAGRTEREVALALESAMRERGAQRPSFETIIAAGPHGALPHAQPRDVAIEPGQLVVIDWGAELDGYCSDCTRTVATGEISETAQEVYALVRSAQLAGLEAVRAGSTGVEVDAVPRGVITDGGHGDHFGHGLGHGVGIEVHEAPRLSFRSEDTLEVGNVVTVEPGVYLPGEVGVRIEDLVVVTGGGCEILTSLSKELRVVG
jgi:Xaa-Pro aminopeptidase